MNDMPSDLAPSDTKTCPYCAETIKAAAVVCRYCGRDLTPQPAPLNSPLSQRKSSKFGGCLKTVGIVVAVILGLAILNVLVAGKPAVTTGTRGTRPVLVTTVVPTLTAAQLQAKATVVPFDDLARNTEQHEGKLVALSGTVVQVMEDGDTADLRVNVDGDYGQTVYIEYPGYNKQRVLDGDTVKMVAQVTGRLTYEAVMGNKVTIPALTALWLEVQK